MKTYKLQIPSWDALVPKEWESVEVLSAGEKLQPAVGTQIHLRKGDQIRGLPEEMIKMMLEHEWIEEVGESEDKESREE